MKLLAAVTVVAGVLAVSQPAQAAGLTITGASGANTASMTFTLINSSTLQVTLSNTSLVGATSLEDVLSGFFFSANMAVSTPTSVRLASGSSIQNCPTCGPSSNVSTQFLAQSGVAGLNGSLPANVLAATDFGFLTDRVGTTANNIPGTNGIGYGLVASNTNFGQSLFTGSPLITRSVVVTYSLSGTAFDINSVSGGFLWGTTLVPVGAYTPYYSFDVGTPEPGTFAMLFAGLAGVICFQRRRRHE